MPQRRTITLTAVAVAFLLLVVTSPGSVAAFSSRPLATAAVVSGSRRLVVQPLSFASGCSSSSSPRQRQRQQKRERFPTSGTVQHQQQQSIVSSSSSSSALRDSLQAPNDAPANVDDAPLPPLTNVTVPKVNNMVTATPITSEQQQQEQQQQQHPLQAWLQDTVLMGVEPSADVAAIMAIYFVEGAVGLARLAQTYLLKDSLHLGPAELSALSGLFVLPWTIKPVYGFLSDGLPLFGYKRKSYLIAAGITGGLSYSLLSWSALWDSLETSQAVAGTCVALLLSSAAVAFCDVVADGMVVTRSRQSTNPATAGSLQSLCWGSAAVGSLLSAYFSGSLLTALTPRAVFGLTAVLPFLVALIAASVDEERIVVAPVSSAPNATFGAPTGALEAFFSGIQEQAETLWGALRQPAIWRPVLFLFLWQSTPTSDGAFFYFLSNGLHLGPEFMGRVRLVTAAAGLLGVWLYQQFFRTTSIKDLLFWSTIVSFPLGLLPLLLITHTNQALGIPDTALIYGDDVVLAVLGQVTFMPTLVLAARLCPPGVEAVLFATLMSIYNGAGTLGTEIGAGLTKWMGVTDSNFDNLGLLTVICNVSSLYPLFFIGWLDGVGDGAASQDEADDTTAVDKDNDGVVLDVDVVHHGDDVH